MWPFASKIDDTTITENARQINQAREDWVRRRSQMIEAQTPENVVEAQDPHTILYGEPEDESLVSTLVRQPQRLGLDPILRSLAIGGVSFVSGFGLGSAHGSTNRALQYRAENAHHLPTSRAGWYLYGKSRNYHSIVGGVTGGLKAGGRYAGWTVLFVALEEGLDRARAKVFARRDEDEASGQRDFLNTVSAAVAVVGIHSKWSNLDRFAAMRSTKLAIRYAVPYGLAQDLLSSLRGDRPWYVEWAFGKERKVPPDAHL